MLTHNYIIMHIILLLLFFGNLSANPCNTALSAIRNEVQQSVANIQPQSQSGATSVSQPRNQPATVIQSCQAASHDQSVSHESASTSTLGPTEGCPAYFPGLLVMTVMTVQVQQTFYQIVI